MWLLKTDTRYLMFDSGRELPSDKDGETRVVLPCSSKCHHLNEYVDGYKFNSEFVNVITLEEWKIDSKISHKFKGKKFTHYKFETQWYKASRMGYFYVTTMKAIHRVNFLDYDRLEFTYSYKYPIIFDKVVINCGYDSLIDILNRTLKNEPGQ